MLNKALQKMSMYGIYLHTQIEIGIEIRTIEQQLVFAFKT